MTSMCAGSEYSLELDLAHPVVPAQSSHRVLGTKIEIKLRKGEGIRHGRPESPKNVQFLALND